MPKNRPRISRIIDPSLHQSDGLRRTGQRLVHTANRQASQPHDPIGTLDQAPHHLVTLARRNGIISIKQYHVFVHTHSFVPLVSSTALRGPPADNRPKRYR